jgi:hypothetical protein
MLVLILVIAVVTIVAVFVCIDVIVQVLVVVKHMGRWWELFGMRRWWVIDMVWSEEMAGW